MFIENDYTKNHKLLDYISNWSKYRYSFDKGFIDKRQDINIIDIFENYQNKEMNIMIEVPMEDTDWISYEYNPKKLSMDLYGTVDLWRTILQENNMNHPGQFCKLRTIRIPDPVRFKKHVTTIYELKNEYLTKVDGLW